LEWKQFFGEYGVEMFLLKKTHLDSDIARTFANRVSNITDRPTEVGFIAILVHRRQNTMLSASCLHDQNATTVQILLEGR
jgi:hypothetical protein